MPDSQNMTKGVKTLRGDPKKAILKLSAPMMLAMLCQALYNIVDGIWVAGLGADQLAAVGLFFPFFMIIIALGAGIGVGGGSAVSRKIGENNKSEADNTAIHTIFLCIIIAVVVSIPLLPFLDNIFLSFSGSEKIGSMAADYAEILFAGTLIIMFSHVANALLRGEGDAKRAMYGMLVGTLLNIILDPIFIYVFKLGVIGAAWATLISLTASALLLSYWLLFKKNTYLTIILKDFSYNTFIIKEILSVGIPSSLAQISMSATMIFINKIVIIAAGTDGVAVFTSGWRIIMFGAIPLIGMSMGVVSVTGAAFGSKDKNKLKTAYFYAIKLGIIIELFIAVIVFIFSKQIAYIFTYSEDAARIMDEIVNFLRVMVVLYPTVPLGMLTSAMFRGVGKGKNSLIVTLFRTIILQVPFAYFLGISFHMGLIGVWIGIIAGNIIAVSLTFIWGRYTVNHILG